MSEVSPSVKRERRDRAAVVLIDRPAKLNALDQDVIRVLADELAAAAADPGVAVTVVTGSGGKAFVAGADIEQMASMTPLQARAFARAGQALAEVIDGAGKPVIAAVDGWALGGGCELAMLCHLRVASAHAKFGQPEVGLGLIPGFGGTQRLARLVGEGRALEMLLTGKPIDAETALAWGLVNRIARERPALDEALDLARAIAAQGPVAVGFCLSAVRNGLSMPLRPALEYEAALFGVTFGTEDMREGTAAFLAKRPATFSGR